MNRTGKRLSRLALSLSCLLWLVLSPMGAAQPAPCSIEITAIDSGHYDAYGERDSRELNGLTGLTVQWRDRGPFRSFVVFRIPQFEGVLTNAVLISDVYSISPDGSETIEFRSVETPLNVLRQGGFGKTGVHADLGDGVSYGSATFPSGYHYGVERALNANAIAAINDARGQNFAMGGAMAALNSDPVYNEFIVLPLHESRQARLRLELSVSFPPTIFAQPTTQNLFTNDATVTVGACGAGPLSYHWFVNGTNFGASPSPVVYLRQELEAAPIPVFVIVSNSFGSATSSVVQVPRMAANIRWPYTNVTLRVGETLQVFASIFTTVSPNEMTWYKDGLPFLLASGNQLFFNPAQMGDSGNYTIVLSNALGVVTSAVFHVEVMETPPTFWEQPRSQTVPLGGLVHLTTYVRAGPPASYQWFHNNALLPGQTGSVLSLSVVRQSNGGDYYVVASNHVGTATSTVATVSVVLDPPQFTQHPQNQIAYPGSQVTFRVTVSGSPFPALQWYFNGEPLFDAVSPLLALNNVSSNHAGNYYCVASNLSGLATSEVAALTVPYLPPLVSGPSDITLRAGDPAVFSITISNPPAHVEWRFNGEPMPGTYFGDPANHYLLLYDVDTNRAGLYWAVVSNSIGITTSRVASLTVTTAPPVFLTHPTNHNVLEGATIDIAFNVTGGPPPELFLYRNGMDTGARPEFQRFRLFDVRLDERGDYVVIASNRVGLAVSQPFRIDVQRAGPLDRWTRRNPIPQGDDLHAITHGAGKFVAVGRDGAIINSVDGTNWNVRSFRTTDELEAVAYGDGRFVAMGEAGMVLTSTNGDDWTRLHVPGVLQFDAVTHGAGQFVAVARLTSVFDRAGIFVSSNGTDWVNASVTAPPTYFLRGIAHGNGVFVVIDRTQSFRSTDLVTWNLGSSNVALFEPESLRFMDGRFVAAGDNGEIVTSPDGIAWTSQNSGSLSRFYDTAHGAGSFVAVGARGQIRRSPDAAVWSPVPSGTVDRLEAVTYADGLFVAVGEGGMIVTSTDAQNWAGQLGGSSRDLDGMAAGNGLLVAVGKNNTVLTSPNGRDWTRSLPPMMDTNAPIDWHGAAFGDGRWVVVGKSTNILTSTNLIDWEVRSYSAPFAYLKDVIHTPGLWVAVGVGGLVLTSPDTLAWTPQATPVPFDLNEIAYGNGLFVVVGDAPTRNGTVLVSTNGAFWNNRTFNTGKNIRAIAFADGLFVAALNDGQIIYTDNPGAVSWQYANTGISGDGQNLRGLTYANGFWVCAGNFGRILTSTNAAIWKSRITPTTENLHAVRFIDGTFVVAGNEGIILQSAPLVSSLSAARQGDLLHLTFSSPWEGVFTLQHSTQFDWQNFATLTNVVGAAEYQMPIPPGNSFRFYRVIAE